MGGVRTAYLSIQNLSGRRSPGLGDNVRPEERYVVVGNGRCEKKKRKNPEERFTATDLRRSDHKRCEQHTPVKPDAFAATEAMVIRGVGNSVIEK